ncbi:MAG: hypothetical protein LBL66_03080 [Clostridiales bacterium]|nr:hypothetical protein [Clostridiales bacterium]
MLSGARKDFCADTGKAVAAVAAGRFANIYVKRPVRAAVAEFVNTPNREITCQE